MPWLYTGSSENLELVKGSIEWVKTGKLSILIHDILFSSISCTEKELRGDEHKWIKKLKATNPEIGYNLRT